MRQTAILSPIITVRISFPTSPSQTSPQATQLPAVDPRPIRQITATMTAEEIIRELNRLRHDPANGRGKGRKVPLKWIAEQAGISRAGLYRIISDRRVSDRSRAALSPVLIMSQRRA